ncbi:hypothetical protein L6252_02785 [Candidatus Parcubacteria bacterium]|nr:hypothetical protein [Candidatus Parcubacteria bacterium]
MLIVLLCSASFLVVIGIIQICHVCDFKGIKHCHQEAKPSIIPPISIGFLVFIVLAVCYLEVVAKEFLLPFLLFIFLGVACGFLSYFITLWSGRNVKPYQRDYHLPHH